MHTVKPFKGGGVFAHHWRKKSLTSRPWSLRWKSVCASTEKDLSNWLREKPLCGALPRAIIAARQTNGFGQRGRIWEAPAGGVWISAAFPLPNKKKSAGILGLAIAVALSHRLEMNNIPVQIKWPNDLLVYKKKLAGLLPRVIHRGNSVRFGRVGLGLNVCNRVPFGGIRLSEILKSKKCQPFLWTAEVLLALDQAMEIVRDEEFVRLEAERLLWAKEFIDPKSGDKFFIDGLDLNGGLKVNNGSSQVVWNRWE